jgi:hypothetical protein
MKLNWFFPSCQLYDRTLLTIPGSLRAAICMAYGRGGESS